MIAASGELERDQWSELKKRVAIAVRYAVHAKDDKFQNMLRRKD